MVKRLARWILNLDQDNIPKPKVIETERIVYRNYPYRQAGSRDNSDPMAGWE